MARCASRTLQSYQSGWHTLFQKRNENVLLMLYDVLCLCSHKQLCITFLKISNNVKVITLKGIFLRNWPNITSAFILGLMGYSSSQEKCREKWKISTKFCIKSLLLHWTGVWSEELALTELQCHKVDH